MSYTHLISALIGVAIVLILVLLIPLTIGTLVSMVIYGTSLKSALLTDIDETYATGLTTIVTILVVAIFLVTVYLGG